MGPIPIKKHEWGFANMVPISISKHKMSFFGISRILAFRDYFLGSKTVFFSQGIHEQKSFELWIFGNVENLKIIKTQF